MASLRTSHDHDVAIIGMAGIYPKAPDLATFWRNITNGVDAMVEIPEYRIESVYVDPDSHAYDKIPHRRAASIEPYATFDPLEFGIPPAQAADGEPEQLLSLKTAALALKDAGLTKPFDRNTAVIVGKGGHIGVAESRHMGCITGVNQVIEIVRELRPDLTENALAEIKKAFQKETIIPRPENNIGFVPHLVAGRIANRLDFRGPSFVVDAACASSLIAVHAACRELALGDCDMAVAGGVHLAIDSTFISVFSHLEALSRGVIRPLDKRADGMLMGEGVGMIVLKRAADAVREGHRIYAIIRGTGISSDGKSSSLMKPSVEGQLDAVKAAWKKSGLDPAQIGLIEAHSPGTPAGDEAELTTLSRFFGPPVSSLAGIGSVKSMVGHCMGAAGITGLIKATLAVYHGVLPPSIHCEEPNELLKKTRFRVITKAEPWDCNKEDRIAGVDAFGFGGSNAHIVLQGHNDGSSSHHVPGSLSNKEGTKESGSASKVPKDIWSERLLLLSANSPDELLKILIDGAPSNSKGSCRLGLLNPTPERIEKATKIIKRGLSWRGRMGLWFSPHGILETDPKVAFLFPGVEAAFDPQIDDILKISGIELPYGVLGESSSDRAKLKTENLVMRGVGVVTLGRILNGALQGIGIYPNIIIGHSIGEWTGMIAAGILAESDVDNLLRTAMPNAFQVPDMVFGVVGCSAEKAGTAISDLEEIAISHDNCPHQAILCGRSDSIDSAIQRLGKEGILCVKLPFQSGFHSPMFKDFLPEIKNVLDSFPLRPSNVPMISATTLREYPSEEKAVRELFLRHLVEPVRFRPLIEGLYKLGFRAFIQMGLGSLIEFTEDTLGHKPYVAIAANHPKRRGLEQLCHVAIAMHVEGYPVDLKQLPLTIMTHTEASATPYIKPEREKTLVLGYSTRKLPPEIIAKYSHPSARIHTSASALTDSVMPQQTGDPMLDSFNAFAAEAIEAQRAVFEAWELRDGREKRKQPEISPKTSPAPEVQNTDQSSDIRKSEAVTTFQKTETPPKNDDEIVVNKILSVDEFPEVLDHTLFYQPSDWSEIEDRLPVAPATMVIELMKNVAQQLYPDKKVISIENLQFLNWVNMCPSTNLTIKMKKTKDLQVIVQIEGYAQGTMIFGDSFPAPPPGDTKPFAQEIPVPITPETLYGKRFMFHGPAYRGVIGMKTMGEDGIDGTLVSLPASGALLDVAGQLFGTWVLLHATENHMAFPIYIRKIRFFGPNPVPGTKFECRVRVLKCEPTLARGNIYVFNMDGTLWSVCEGWTDTRLETTKDMWKTCLKPDSNLIASPREEGYTLIHQPFRSKMSRWRILMSYLRKHDREKVPSTSFYLARNYLLGTIVIIDAVRNYLWNHGYGPMYPIEIRVRYKSNGQPIVSGPFENDLRVSFSQKEETAVACVREGEDLGIELERVEPRPQGFIDATFTPEEIDILTKAGCMTESLRDEWITRAWCGKEVVAKQKEGGLRDNFRNWYIEEIRGERLRIGGVWINTRQDGSYIVAWTG